MTAHIPGPWQYRTLPHDDWGTVHASNGPIVAHALSGSWDVIDYDAHRTAGTDPYEANARLIAAAPDLLAALKRLLATINPGNADEHAVGCNCVIHEARAAIAKATGAA
jgi:hypothetical protein